MGGAMSLKMLICVTIFSVMLYSCQSSGKENLAEVYKKEILETENSFAKLVLDKGLKIAFTTYAAEDAVLKRENKLIKGRNEIEKYYSTYKYPDAKIKWEPDFIDVSESGDLAYSYGIYNFEAVDDSGKVIKDTGVFHTIWKKQPDGPWLYVWD